MAFGVHLQADIVRTTFFNAVKALGVVTALHEVAIAFASTNGYMVHDLNLF